MQDTLLLATPEFAIVSNIISTPLILSIIISVDGTKQQEQKKGIRKMFINESHLLNSDLMDVKCFLY